MTFFDELKKNLSGVSGTVAKKSGTVLELQKAKLKKVSLEGDLKDIYAKLGQLYFENYADGDMPKEMAALCEKVTACQHAIDEAEQRTAYLKGVVICSKCQAEVDREASYCPKCGAEIVHVVEEEDTEAVEAEEEKEEESQDIEEPEESQDTEEPEEAQETVETDDDNEDNTDTVEEPAADPDDFSGREE